MSLWKTEVKNGVMVASYFNPPMNYIGAEGTRELVELIEAWHAPDIRTVILTGGVEGKFITHYNAEELAGIDTSELENFRALGISPIPGFNAMLKLFQDLPKPVIVAMNGDAMGGGFEFCLACDIRIAQRGDYRIGLPETKLGIIPGGGGTQRLPRLIGVGRAIEFILRGRIVPPEEALALGLVHELAEDALARAQEIAKELAAMPVIGLARAKFAAYTGSETHIGAGLDIENAAFLDTMLSEDAALVVQKFLALPLEKRRAWFENPTHPVYKGR